MVVDEITKLIEDAVNGEVFGIWYLIGAALVFFMQAGFALWKPVLQGRKMQGILL